MVHNILLLGSGMMTPPLIGQLLSYGDTKITIASNVLADAQALVATSPNNLSAVYLDIKNKVTLENLIAAHDHVISFIPPWMHTPIAQACLKVGRNMTTSSYISPAMEQIHPEVKAKGLIFLNESGLDPGIDIMGTLKVVDEAKAAGFKVVSYESYCGGLPVADQADNPLGYKFSWNPGAAIKASRNTATYRQNGKKVVTNTPLKCAVIDDFSVSMKLETYPNRDSLVFLERFGMQDCETFIRGTYRFTGFSDIISSFHDIGLTSDDIAPDGVKTLRDLLESRLQGGSTSLGAGTTSVVDKFTLGMDHADQDLIKRALGKVDFSYIKEDRLLAMAIQNIIKSMKFLGFFDDNQKVSIKDKNGQGRPYLDVLGDVMGVKLALSDEDRDLVIMRHVFHIQDPKTNQRWEHTSTMVASGQSKASKGISIMSKTVGITCALATRLVLEKKIKQRGVLSPMTPDIYGPILRDLEKHHGVTMVEESGNPAAWAKMGGPSLKAKL